MSSKKTIPCVILAGGSSVRFGSPKGLALIAGKPLIQIVHNKLASQTSGPIAINASANGPYGGFRNELIEDIFVGGVGPLAGIHAAIVWAERIGQAAVVTASIDTPLLPDDLIARLSKDTTPAIASSLNRPQPICGYWPVSLRHTLELAIADGMRGAQKWARHCGAELVDFSSNELADPFFNINTLDDLHTARKIFDE